MTAVLADVLRGLTQLTVDPSLLTALAAAIVAGAVLTAALALLTSVAGLAAGTPMISRVAALREKSWGAVFGRQRDPDAAGRPRPRAPSAAPTAS
jgi:hypothetical protein